MGGEEATGRPADGAGQHPKDRNEEEVSAACRALRPGAAGLKGSVAHPIDGERNKQCDRAGAALARSPQHQKAEIRCGGFINRRGCACGALRGVPAEGVAGDLRLPLRGKHPLLNNLSQT